jgi:hypothetical protein
MPNSIRTTSYGKERMFRHLARFSAVEIEILKTLLMLCGAGLFVSVLLATYGLDLSPGFF